VRRPLRNQGSGSGPRSIAPGDDGHPHGHRDGRDAYGHRIGERHAPAVGVDHRDAITYPARYANSLHDGDGYRVKDGDYRRDAARAARDRDWDRHHHRRGDRYCVPTSDGDGGRIPTRGGHRPVGHCVGHGGRHRVAVGDADTARRIADPVRYAGSAADSVSYVISIAYTMSTGHRIQVRCDLCDSLRTPACQLPARVIVCRPTYASN
jgi:hypothetical protein